MSHYDDTPISGGGALVGVPNLSPYTDVVDDRAASDPNSYAAVDEDCYGLLTPFLLSFIPGIVMYAISTVLIIASAISWPMSTGHKVGTILILLLGLALLSFGFYRLSIGGAAGISAATYLLVAIALPMPELMLGTYCVLIAITMVGAAVYYFRNRGVAA